jgi:hypothetical protein
MSWNRLFSRELPPSPFPVPRVQSELSVPLTLTEWTACRRGHAKCDIKAIKLQHETLISAPSMSIFFACRSLIPIALLHSHPEKNAASQTLLVSICTVAFLLG